MVEQGEDALLVDGELAISESTPQTGEQAVVHTSDTARAESNPEQGDPVVMVAEGLAQSKAGGIGGIVLEGLEADDRLLFAGDSTTIRVDVVNNTDESRDVTLEFTRNGNSFNTQTQTIPSRGQRRYSVPVSQPDAGEHIYQAVTSGGTTSNELKLTWLDVRPAR